MNFTLILFSLYFILSGSLSPAATISSAPNVPVEVNLSTLSGDYKHRVNMTRMVKPQKVTGNPFRDSFLQARCGDEILATDSRRIAPSDFGKDIAFSLSFELTKDVCENLILTVELQTNGITIESPYLSFSTSIVGETVKSFIARTKFGLEKKAVDLVKAHSLMSSVSGSQESFHCLIVSLESDVFIPIESIDEIKDEYRKLYGGFQKEIIKCPTTGVLASRIATCSVAENKFTLFCVLYDRVIQEAAWFSAAVAEGETIIARESDAHLITEMNLLLDKIRNTKEALEIQFGR